MKTKVIVVLILLVFTIACQRKTMTFEEVYPGNLSDVTKIEIRHGGGKLKTVIDQMVIEKWLTEIKDISFIPKKNHEKIKGYLYAVNLYEGETLTFSFTTTEINDNYEVNEALIQKLEELFVDN
ncbi:hypothetical protein [Lederbergia citrea]|uniref:Lipoprotein n=1 Tax=Lederbergia citrea TaxID=2833581 RepID=A0A942UR78_9BACI|nr:hypothetical protein [Lederbergia citrea]MBS4205548.1 hypothetical protein [Lederbergia citrea]MBS4224117.1 hypothetical protein [Lederbergia citrea]